MNKAFRSPENELVPASKNPPLKPDISREVKAFDARQRLQEETEESAAALSDMLKEFKKPSMSRSAEEVSKETSGVRMKRPNANPLPDAPPVPPIESWDVDVDSDQAA